MNHLARQNVYEQLKIDEGVVYEVYKDHLGYKTLGVGHLITEDDPEYGHSIGTKVSEARVKQCFENDLNTAVSECSIMFGQSIWNTFPMEVKEICVNMMFNLGRPRFSKFKKTINYLEEHNWKAAGKEARDSVWYNQVGDRAERLCTRLERA